MANVIDDATIDYVGILAKLELSDEEKEQAKKDMASMLDYIDQLNELDTTGVEPMSHVFPIENVMREDVVTNGDESEKTLFNAPERKDKTFVVPKTVEQKGAAMGLLDLTAVELAGQIKSGKTTAVEAMEAVIANIDSKDCLLYTSPSPRDR